ncbi:hypothetical protein PAMP_000927 [Pampus punctatissimus]
MTKEKVTLVQSHPLILVHCQFWVAMCTLPFTQRQNFGRKMEKSDGRVVVRSERQEKRFS